MNTVYNDLASFGRGVSVVGLVVGIVIGAIFAIIGISLLLSKPLTTSKRTTALISIGLGLLVATLAVLVWFVSKHNTAFAAAEGGVAGIEMIRDAFR